jgi:hypothetical protein
VNQVNHPAVHNILVVYCATDYPLRATIRDHLYSFSRYTKHRVFYLNIAVCGIPDYFRRLSFDLIILHTTAIGRWFPQAMWQVLGPVCELRSFHAPVIAMPQDEFLNSDQLIELAREFDLRHIFSVAPESEWPKLYGRIDGARTRIHQVLTGYLDAATVRRIGEMAAASGERTIDIGYRAYEAPPWLGRVGYRKRQLAVEFARESARYGLVSDISTQPSDTILGDDWYRFLLRCKYTIGVEGGSSINDHDGSIKQCTAEYLARHPDATFEEVEAACFPGKDGNLRLTCLSPRHLEACATRTCQLLIEGDYNGILHAGKHYIEVRKDFSNLAEVLELVREDCLRGQIVANAYRDIVQSNKYTYQQFVDFVLSAALADAPTRDRSDEDDTAYRRALDDDRKSWRKVKRISAIVRRIPTNVRGVGRVTQWLRNIYLALR